MTTKTRSPRGRTGTTAGGHVRYVKVDRIGGVTIYKRGETFSLYYRENGRTVRSIVDGNVAVARATASKVNAQLEDGQRSMFSFLKVTPRRLVQEYLAYVRDGQRLAWRTTERYRAALERFVDFAESDGGIATVDRVEEATIQDFVTWLRGQLRTRNGAAGGTRDHYRAAGIRFILSTCRTAFNWGRKRRYLPPYADNPFAGFPIQQIRDRDERQRQQLILEPDELEDFLAACDAWQRPVFEILATYGLRVGELTHLLVDDVDFEKGVFYIRSKPALLWFPKTNLERELAIVGDAEKALRDAIGERKAGFVFVERPFAAGEIKPAITAASPSQFEDWLERQLMEVQGDGGREVKDVARDMERVARTVGKISEKRVRQEFMTVTKAIGRADVTKVHSLRHLFSTRAQANGMNPLVVQQILGHSTLQMTAGYTHLGIDVQRRELSRLAAVGSDRRHGTATKNKKETTR